MKKLQTFINNLHALPTESFERFKNLIQLKKFSNKDILAKYGETAKELFILKKGVVRSFYTGENGKEYIRNLFTPYSALGPLEALVNDKPANVTYDCLTDCEIYTINFKKLKELTSKDKEISQMYSSALENVFILLTSRIYNLTVLNATKRYLKLREDIVNIENEIPQYHIASYLNISPVQLSRIRKEIYSK
jgi:CRP-like cAMP-binding protein